MNYCRLLPLRELHFIGETIVWRDPVGSWVCLPPVYDCVRNHPATYCHICRTCPKKHCAEHVPKSGWEKWRVLQNAEKKLVLGFLHSVNHIGSPQNESYIQSNFIPGQNNKSSKRKLKNIFFLKAAHNSRHNTISSKHNQHQYLHFTYLQLRKVRTGVFSFADHFSTKLKQSNHNYIYV